MAKSVKTPPTKEQIHSWRMKAKRYEELSEDIFNLTMDDEGNVDLSLEIDPWEAGKIVLEHFGLESEE